jgi:hypothetical protein
MREPLRKRAEKLRAEFHAAHGDVVPPVHLGVFTVPEANLSKLLRELKLFDQDSQDRPFCCTDAQGNVLDLQERPEKLIGHLSGGGSAVSSPDIGGQPLVDFCKLRPLSPNSPGAHLAAIST